MLINRFDFYCRGVIHSFVEKHFPVSVEKTKTMSLFGLFPSSDQDKTQNSRKRKSTHRRTTKRSISCDTNESSEDSDIDCYSSFVQANKRRSTNKRRDQNNNRNHLFDDLHNSDHENSCDSLLIEDDFARFITSTASSFQFQQQQQQQQEQQQRTFAEILGETEIGSGLPVKRIPKKEISTTIQNCKRFIHFHLKSLTSDEFD